MVEGNFKNQLTNLIDKVCTLYPHIDRGAYLNHVLEMNVVENDDITDRRVVLYHQPTNTMKINKEEAEKGIYDLEYYMTLTLLAMQQPYSKELEGLRYGYNAGIASMLVGNTVEETATEVVPGVDIYETLRDCIASLSDKIGYDRALEICNAEDLEAFKSLYTGFGLESPDTFLNQMNYLYNNAGNASLTQLNGIVDSIKKSEVPHELGKSMNL